MAKKDKVFEALSDQQLAEMVDEACELSEIKRRAETKLRPMADHIKAELLRRGVTEYETQYGNPAVLVDVFGKEYPQLEQMRLLLPKSLFDECVRKVEKETQLRLGKRLG